MSDDDLIKQMEAFECDWRGSHAADLMRTARDRIRELESACYRLTEERDRLKAWADKYHDEVLELRRQIEERE